MQREFDDACRRIALSLANAHKDRDFSSVIFASSWSREGTTTVVNHVAAQLSGKHGVRVRVIDLAAMDAPGYGREETGRTVGFNSILSIGQSNGARSSTGVANRAIEQRSPKGDSNGLEVALACLGSEYDFLIVDAPPLMQSSAGLEAGALIPRLVLVVQAGRTQTGTLEHVSSQLKTFKVQMTAAVLTRYKTYIPRFLDRWLTQ